MDTNIIDEYINYCKNKTTEYTKIILGKLFIKEIFTKLFEAYKESMFYDYYGNLDNIKEISVKQYLKNVKEELTDKTLYYDEEIKVNYQAFLYAIELVELTKINDSLINKITEYKKSIKNNDDDELKKIVKEDITKKLDFFNTFKTDDFYLKYDKTNITNVYDTKILYNITFPEIYSDIAIKKSFNKDIINEQKMFVYYYLLSYEILQNIINNKNNKTFLVEFDYTLFEKSKKIQRVLDIIDNDLLKEKMIYKITYKDYLKYEDNIKDMLKKGYKFACFIDDSYKTSEDVLIKLNLFEFIIIDEDKYYYDELKRKPNVIIFNW